MRMKYRPPGRSRGTFAAMRTRRSSIGRRALVLLLLTAAGILGCGRAGGTPLTLASHSLARSDGSRRRPVMPSPRPSPSSPAFPSAPRSPRTTPGVIEAVRSRRVDLAFVHPVGYVLANREAGCQILVRDVWQGKTAYTARFYVRKGSGIEKVEDLRGQDRGLRRSGLELRVHLPDGAPDQAGAREGP